MILVVFNTIKRNAITRNGDMSLVSTIRKTVLALVVAAIVGTCTLKTAVPVSCQWLVLRELWSPHGLSPMLVVGVGITAVLHWFWVLSDPHTWFNLWCAWFFSMLWLVLVPYCAEYGWRQPTQSIWLWYRVGTTLLLDISAIPCITIGALVATTTIVPDASPPRLISILAVSVELLWRALRTPCNLDCVLATAATALLLAAGAAYHGMRNTFFDEVG